MPVTMLDPNEGSDETLPFELVGRIPIKPPGERWLVRPIWGRAAVGFLFGAPKSWKSWLGLDIATSVASGTPCLEVFEVQDPGPVLIYLAEDALEDVRTRVASLCARRHLDIQGLNLHVITAPALRLDLPTDQRRLCRTLEVVKPRLLVLDPLVRMHALNENDASEISRLLGYLRELQRTHDMAVLVIHHARKRGAAHAGLSIRGSSDFYAWTDSSASLTREKGRRLVLEVEHRSARSPDPIHLELHSREDGTEAYLKVLQGEAAASPSPSIENRVLEFLEAHGGPQTNRELREALQIKNSRVGQVLADLQSQGLVERKGKAGWSLVTRSKLADPHQPSLPLLEPRDL